MDSFSSRIKKYLDRLADSQKSPNSFLFIGPEGTGKKEAAIYFISKLAGKDGDAGFRKRLEDKVHPDVVIIEPESEEKKRQEARKGNRHLSGEGRARALEIFPLRAQEKILPY